MTADDDFERFVAGQSPLRPDHPDFVKLQTVVQIVEDYKARGLEPEEVYADICDIYSLSYLAANRAGMNIPDEPRVSRMDAIKYMANSWVEGFLYGVLFEMHQKRDDA